MTLQADYDTRRPVYLRAVQFDDQDIFHRRVIVRDDTTPILDRRRW
jgi:hypothetical protein